MAELTESRYNYRLKYDDQIVYFNGITRQFIPVPDILEDTVESILHHPEKATNTAPSFLEKLQSTGLLVERSVDEVEMIRERYHQARNDLSYQLTISLGNVFSHASHDEYRASEGVMSSRFTESIKKHFDRYIQENSIRQLQLEWYGKQLTQETLHVMEEISLYANGLCTQHNVDFHVGITTYKLPEKLEDLARITSLPVKSIRFILNLSTAQNKQQSAKAKEISDFVERFPQWIALFPEMFFVILVRGALDSIHFDLFLNQMNEHIDESVRKNVSVFFNDESMHLQEDESVRTEKLRQLFQSGYNQKWDDLLPTICTTEKKHAYAINLEGNVGKCLTRAHQGASGYLTTHGNIFWDETKLHIDSDIPLFENIRCLSCKHLPICMGEYVSVQRLDDRSSIPSSCLLLPWGISPESVVRYYCDVWLDRYSKSQV
ncbi:hypothetical protein [Microbacter margulisiae]|uniref:Uncharacterized protein n=1 Tax=Microbacter margulisiae TaxID=1350067 RepID=A0A7W5DN78_9PORP|nr:hypothetical protein [Microbacter margulisiae]MBB3186040.1 uncharacterized protein [Microbacter margulisiae]